MTKKNEKVAQNYLQKLFSKTMYKIQMGANLINTYQSKVTHGSFKRLMAEQYYYTFLIMCKAV